MQQFTTEQQDAFCETLCNRIKPDMQDIYADHIVIRMADLIVTDFTTGKIAKGKPPLDATQINHKLATIKKYPKAIESLYKTYKTRGELDELWILPTSLYRVYLDNP